MSNFRSALLFAIAIAASSCSTQQVQTHDGAEATSRAIDTDRILVTVDAAIHGNVAALSPTGRVDYMPLSPADIRARQLSKAQRLAEHYQLQIEEDWPIPALDIHCFVFRLDDPDRKSEVLARLEADPHVDSAQPLQFFYGAGAPAGSIEPAGNDPLSGWDEELNRQLLEAHRLTTGKSVTIAIVDTGADLDHEDLKGASIVSHDFVDGLDAPPPEMHGTAVAGLLVARMANDIGIRGYTPDANVLLLRSCWEREENSEPAVCNTFTLAKALSFALASDAAIINLSISGPRDPLLERIAMKFADNNQLLVAAGESSQNFPASVPHSLVAMDRSISHPPAAMLTLLPGNRYGMRGGSSMAAARLTGIVALMKQLEPTLSLSELRQQLAQSSHGDPGQLAAVTHLARQGSDRGEDGDSGAPVK